jgi:hypothetical protein
MAICATLTPFALANSTERFDQRQVIVHVFTLKARTHAAEVPGATTFELELAAAIGGLGLIHTFADALSPALASGALERRCGSGGRNFPDPISTVRAEA